MRLHTDTTLNDFRAATTTLGRTVRMFIRGVCSQYDTTELPNEMAARGRREVALAAKRSNASTPAAPKKRQQAKPKKLNLSTYKYHALGDYPDLIAKFGTADNASTQTVHVFLSKIRKATGTFLLISTQGELQHKMIKRRFPRTNRKNYVAQLAKAELRERFMRQLVAPRLRYRANLSQIEGRRAQRRKRAQAETDEADAVDSLNTTQPYHMADSHKEHENILEWVHTNRTDVATKVRLARHGHPY